jgi:hypothetical protein
VNGVLFAPFDYRDADEPMLVDEQQEGRDSGATGYLASHRASSSRLKWT